METVNINAETPERIIVRNPIVDAGQPPPATLKTQVRRPNFDDIEGLQVKLNITGKRVVTVSFDVFDTQSNTSATTSGFAIFINDVNETSGIIRVETPLRSSIHLEVDRVFKDNLFVIEAKWNVEAVQGEAYIFDKNARLKVVVHRADVTLEPPIEPSGN